MSTPRNNRNLVLLDETVITAIGAQSFRAKNPPWVIRPRFQLVVASLTIGGGGAPMKMKIEHGEIGDNVADLFTEFSITANGVYVAYTEDLTTSYPFSRMRANVTEMGDVTTATCTLFGLFDQQ